MCVYICVYVYLCICVYACVLCIYVYVCMYLCVCMYMYMCVYVHIYVCTCVCMYVARSEIKSEYSNFSRFLKGFFFFFAILDLESMFGSYSEGRHLFHGTLSEEWATSLSSQINWTSLVKQQMSQPDCLHIPLWLTWVPCIDKWAIRQLINLWREGVWIWHEASWIFWHFNNIKSVLWT